MQNLYELKFFSLQISSTFYLRT